jgi:hypothetical protein
VRLIANARGNLALIYAQSAKDGAQNFFVSIFYPGTNSWSQGRQLIQDSNQLRDVSAYFDHDGQLRLAYLDTEILRTTRNVNINGVPQVIENIPQDGRTDLDAVIVNGASLTNPVLANISTRLPVQTGDNVLIGGFIVTGTQSKKIIVRAIGPSLPFPSALTDPILELHDSTGALLETNDNWVESPNKQAIIDSTIAPTDPLESAIVKTVTPGAYTAIVRGANNATGIGVVEAYDLDSVPGDSKLANIATRGFVQTGDNVLIAGTIVVGQTSQKVIIRAIGPSLPIAGVLADPFLELHDSNGALLEANDNWVDSPNKQAIIDSTIPPTNNLESAIVRTLPPAAYTAIVRGVGGTTGIAVIEVYALD